MKIQSQSLDLLHRIVKESDTREWSAEQSQQKIERNREEIGSFDRTASMTWISIPHELHKVSLGYGSFNPSDDPLAGMFFNIFQDTGSESRPRNQYDVYVALVDGKVIQNDEVVKLVHVALKEVDNVVKIAQNYLIKLGRNPELVCELDWQQSFSNGETTQSFTSTKDGFVISCRRVDKNVLDTSVQLYEASIASEGNLFAPILVSERVANKVFDTVEKFHRGDKTPTGWRWYDPERSWGEFAMSFLPRK